MGLALKQGAVATPDRKIDRRLRECPQTLAGVWLAAFAVMVSSGPHNAYEDFHSKGEALFWNNLEPMHYENAKAKGDSISSVIAEIHYVACKCSICASKDQLDYGIMDASTSHRVD